MTAHAPAETSALEPIDVVYTWVDDSWPGYIETLNRFADTKHDVNRNRTRDNLDVLKYSLRSLHEYAPWIRNVYLFSMRPQIPEWLAVSHPRIRVVHHDDVMDPENLPTFNSFAILSHVHKLPGLSDRFLYLADDFLMGQPVARHDLLGDGATDPMYFEHRDAPDPSVMDSDKKSPWDSGRAFTNHLMDEAYGAAQRRDPGHLPCVVRRGAWGAMAERWPEDFARLRSSRFRAKYNIVPEFMYPHTLIHAGLGHAVPDHVYKRDVDYVAINNWDMKARIDTWRLARHQPKFYALNDDFGDAANPRVVARWRRCLDRILPTPSPFEKNPPLPAT